MNSNELFTATEHFLAASPYYLCLLVVHPEIAKLHNASEQILKRYAWPSLSIGTTVSQALLTIAPKQRSRQAKHTLANATQAHAPGPLLCTDIELLFEPDLSLEPLRLLREASRQTTLIVTWPGTFANGILAYAVNTHTHYQTWSQTDLCDNCIVTL